MRGVPNGEMTARLGTRIRVVTVGEEGGVGEGGDAVDGETAGTGGGGRTAMQEQIRQTGDASAAKHAPGDGNISWLAERGDAMADTRIDAVGHYQDALLLPVQRHGKLEDDARSSVLPRTRAGWTALSRDAATATRTRHEFLTGMRADRRHGACHLVAVQFGGDEHRLSHFAFVIGLQTVCIGIGIGIGWINDGQHLWGRGRMGGKRRGGEEMRGYGGIRDTRLDKAGRDCTGTAVSESVCDQLSRMQ